MRWHCCLMTLTGNNEGYIPLEGKETIVVVNSNPLEAQNDERRLALKYRGVIQEIGPLVHDFLPHGILIFFGAMAPDELREVSLVHDGQQLIAPLAIGDLFVFLSENASGATAAETQYHVTAVGEMANANLATLGHVVVHFDGATTPPLPGAISVEPSLSELPSIGTTFEFLELER